MTDRFNHCAARTLLVLALVACAVRAACQETEYKMEIGGMAGGSFYMGDANWSRPFKDMRFAGAVVARQLFNPHMAVKYDFAVAGIAGDTRDFAGKFPGGGQATFSRTLFDIGAQFEYNFLPYGTGGGYRDTRRVTPYITGGVGLTFAPAPADFVGSLNFPLGRGVKWKAARRLNVGAEFTFRFSMTDKLDVTDRGPFTLNDPYNIKSRGIKNKDTYAFVTIFITYDICPKGTICNNL